MAAPANSNLRRSFTLINMICATSSLTKFRVSGFDRLILPPSAERTNVYAELTVSLSFKAFGSYEK